MESIRYTMRAVVAKTGISPHTIRAWERRYSALSPDRTGTNQRLYSEEDLERLELLFKATEKGHGIGQIARLSIPDLKTLVSTEPTVVQASSASIAVTRPESFHDECELALDDLDPQSLEFALVRGAAILGVPALLDTVVVPFLVTMGRRWEERTISIAQEHMATAVLRTYLDRVRLSITPATFAPTILVTTPAHQHHEIGAVLVAITAAMLGWSVTYLGPNLPADDIVGAAKRMKADAVAISLVFPDNDPDLPEELRRLRHGLNQATPIIVGGRAAMFYFDALTEINAKVIMDLESLRTELANLNPRA